MCFAFDVDGVLFDVSHRLGIAEERSKRRGTSFWDEFFNAELIHLDTPREVARDLVRSRASRGYVVVVSGRPRRLYGVTIEQIATFFGIRPYRVYMRSEGDYRQSDAVKAELIGKALNDGLDIVEYHDDDLRVLRTVKRGYPHITLYLHEKNRYRVVWKGVRGAYLDMPSEAAL